MVALTREGRNAEEIIPSVKLAAKAFYEKHGGKTIIFARFMPIVRTFAPVVAGVAEMDYAAFLSFNVVGGIAWVSSMTLIGYGLGRAIPGIDRYIYWVIAVVILLSLIPGFVHYWKQKQRN